MATRRSSRRSGRGSGRGARGSQRGLAASTSGRSSQRLADDEDVPIERGRKKTGGGGGTEMMICLGVLGVLVIAVGVFWKIKKDEQAAYAQSIREKRRAREANLNRAYKAFINAERIGKPFVIGNATDAKPEDLLSSLKGDDKIYNVIFDRNYKNKKNKAETQQIAMDSSRMRVTRYGKSEIKTGITMTYAKANNETLPVFLAEKTYKAEEGDKVNQGGRITVIVLAEEENKP